MMKCSCFSVTTGQQFAVKKYSGGFMSDSPNAFLNETCILRRIVQSSVPRVVKHVQSLFYEEGGAAIIME